MCFLLASQILTRSGYGRVKPVLAVWHWTERASCQPTPTPKHARPSHLLIVEFVEGDAGRVVGLKREWYLSPHRALELWYGCGLGRL